MGAEEHGGTPRGLTRMNEPIPGRADRAPGRFRAGEDFAWRRGLTGRFVCRVRSQASGITGSYGRRLPQGLPAWLPRTSISPAKTKSCTSPKSSLAAASTIKWRPKAGGLNWMSNVSRTVGEVGPAAVTLLV